MSAAPWLRPPSQRALDSSAAQAGAEEGAALGAVRATGGPGAAPAGACCCGSWLPCEQPRREAAAGCWCSEPSPHQPPLLEHVLRRHFLLSGSGPLFSPKFSSASLPTLPKCALVSAFLPSQLLHPPICFSREIQQQIPSAYLTWHVLPCPKG